MWNYKKSNFSKLKFKVSKYHYYIWTLTTLKYNFKKEMDEDWDIEKWMNITIFENMLVLLKQMTKLEGIYYNLILAAVAWGRSSIEWDKNWYY